MRECSPEWYAKGIFWLAEAVLFDLMRGSVRQFCTSMTLNSISQQLSAISYRMQSIVLIICSRCQALISYTGTLGRYSGSPSWAFSSAYSYFSFRNSTYLVREALQNYNAFLSTSLARRLSTIFSRYSQWQSAKLLHASAQRASNSLLGSFLKLAKTVEKQPLISLTATFFPSSFFCYMKTSNCWSYASTRRSNALIWRRGKCWTCDWKVGCIKTLGGRLSLATREMIVYRAFSLFLVLSFRISANGCYSLSSLAVFSKFSKGCVVFSS